MALGIPLNPLYDLLYFVVFFSLHVAPHFHCIVCPWTRPAKIALLGVLSNLPDTIFLRSGITARVQNSLFGGVDA
jgi:hypothetical protein